MRLSSNSIQSQLQTKRLGRELLIIDECTSTNDVASRMAGRGAKHGYIVLAEKQTQGRGRQAREWISPEGGIWMTTVLRPTSHFRPLDGLPLIGALATAVVLSLKHTVKAMVRWPNDVMFQDRKLAGTMVEAKFSGNALVYALLGLGLNANFNSRLISERVENAITLLDILGSPVDRAELISQILLEIERLYDQVSWGDSSQVLNLLKQNECTRGNRVTIQLSSGRLDGVFDGYETLTRVRIRPGEADAKMVDTSSVISVAYPAASDRP